MLDIQTLTLFFGSGAPTTFLPALDVPISTAVTSRTITPDEIANGETVSVTGGTVSENGGSYGAGPLTYSTGDTYSVMGTSSGSYETTTSVVLTASGGWTETFTVTTMAEPNAAFPYTFPFELG